MASSTKEIRPLDRETSGLRERFEKTQRESGRMGLQILRRILLWWSWISGCACLNLRFEDSDLVGSGIGAATLQVSSPSLAVQPSLSYLIVVGFSFLISGANESTF